MEALIDYAAIPKYQDGSSNHLPAVFQSSLFNLAVAKAAWKACREMAPFRDEE